MKGNDRPKGAEDLLNMRLPSLSSPLFPKERAVLQDLLRQDQQYARSLPKSFSLDEWHDKYQKPFIKRGEELLRILDKIGSPTVDKVGHDGSRAAWLIAQHAPIPLLHETLNKFKSAYAKDPENIFYQAIPLMEDRLRVDAFGNKPPKKQLYGTIRYIDLQGNTCLFPVWDFKNVNRRRNKFGLAPLREVNNGKWPSKEDSSL